MICYTDKHKIPFQIDAEYWEVVQRYTWRINGYGYPETGLNVAGRQARLRLHSFLFGKAPRGLEWDHRDRDPLNNQRENLRLVTHTINMQNIGLRVDNKSGIAGVNKYGAGWMVHISANGTRIYLGYFASLEAATKIRVEAEQDLWGANR